MAKSRKQKKPALITVPFEASQIRKPPSIREWAHPEIWTNRMLDTLEVGVKGGKWHALIDKVFDKRNLYDSARKVLKKKGAAGVDHQQVEDFSATLLQGVNQLHEELRGNQYQPKAVRRVWIDKPGSKEKRPLGIPTLAAYCTSFNKR